MFQITVDDIAGGQGVMSEILRCTITFVDSVEPSDIYTTILKIPGTTAMFKANNININDDELIEKMAKPINLLHEAECKFYNNLAPILDVPVPKVYKTVEWIYETFKPLLVKLGKIITNKEYFQYAFFQCYKDLNLEPVIVHGDIHLGNIIWSINDNGMIQDDVAAFIDWQVIYEGSPMYDLARFLAMSASGEIRREAETFAIKYYLECLTKEFDGDSNKVPYTFEKLKKAYNFAFLCNILFMFSAGVFFLNAAEQNERNESKRKIYLDFTVAKIQQACEDAVKLLEYDNMKDVWDNFGI
uniref:CHK kinase-like domain-containing protein n=1 Tax=Panagrolaimus sp. ES5 TaxID=591445 RepID=A0AC34FQH1_9BILA